MKMKLKVYASHPITGLNGGDVVEYYMSIKDRLEYMGLTALVPLIAKGKLRDIEVLNSHGYDEEKIPLAGDHAIKERDQWMVTQSDLVLVDFSGSTAISIGCCSELAWADMLRKHTVVVLPDENIHRHAFVLQEADIIFKTLDDAIDYIETLVNCKI